MTKTEAVDRVESLAELAGVDVETRWEDAPIGDVIHLDGKPAQAKDRLVFNLVFPKGGRSYQKYHHVLIWENWFGVLDKEFESPVANQLLPEMLDARFWFAFHHLTQHLVLSSIPNGLPSESNQKTDAELDAQEAA